MDSNVEVGLQVAEYLLQIKAIELNPRTPFTWASGLKSPIYCDNRKTLSYPTLRTHIRQQFVNAIQKHFGPADVIVGVATGGIAIGALIAQEMGLPFAYVRSEAKKHGLGNQVEGVIEPKQKVIVIEDLVSTGKSSLAAVDALRNIDANVVGMLAIFTYEFQQAEEAFRSAQVKLHTLTNYHLLLEKAVQKDYITEDQLDSLKEWRKSPSDWSANFLSRA
ncbi:MAG: orotate phosphoribosyltransferase [Bacteroidota bacterium]|jgi:orotate phosphoribosyltransferase